MIQYREEDCRLTFAVRIVPRASRSEIMGEYNGALRIRSAAPPVEGAANRELIRFLAKKLRLPQNAFEIVSGVNSKNKIIRVRDAGVEAFQQLSKLK